MEIQKKRRVKERIELNKDKIDALNKFNGDNSIPISEKEDIAVGIPRKYTVSLAIPGSIVSNAQSQELRTYLVGQLARAFAVFNVDEVIVFNDHLDKNEINNSNNRDDNDNKLAGNFQSASNFKDPHLFLARVLQYLETPQYLRKLLFPIHKDLQYAGLLNPLDCPHHLRATEASKYREGIVLDKPVKANSGSFVNCGLRKEVKIDKHLVPGTRVTVELNEGFRDPNSVKKANLEGKAVSPKRPVEQDGLYWGYSVRLANNVTQIFDNCPYKEGYDLKIGTSERGDSIDQTASKMPEFKHLLIVLGGVLGIEAAVEADQSLELSGEDSKDLFDYWLNVCPDQGSRTIRTEEALLITMSALRPFIIENGDKN